MKQWRARLGWFLLGAGLFSFPQRSPAPLVYTPGEGWRYEQVGGDTGWRKTRAKDQMEVAQAAFARKDYSTASRAAKRLVKVWEFSDYAPEAQYMVGRCLEEENKDEAAFKAYQRLIERYPKIENYDEVLHRQFFIANRYLSGQRFKVYDLVPVFPSMDKTIKMYEQVIKNGPYSEIAPLAQMNIGLAHENKKTFFVSLPEYTEAAKAYERAADRYNDRPIGTEGLYRVGLAYNKQAKTAEYDQSIASQAIATFTDFSTLHEKDPRVPEAQKLIDALRTEQARGSFEIARYYEKRRRLEGAKIYYNDVLNKDPGSSYADQARQRLEAIKKRGS